MNAIDRRLNIDMKYSLQMKRVVGVVSKPEIEYNSSEQFHLIPFRDATAIEH